MEMILTERQIKAKKEFRELFVFMFLNRIHCR